MKNRITRKKGFLLATIIIITLIINFFPQHSSGEEGKIKNAIIFVIDDEKTLYLYDDEKIIFAFPCETGLSGMGKTEEGDRKTPIGRYEIIWMASKKGNNDRDGALPIIDGITWCEDSEIYYGPEGPKDEKLWTDAYGGEDAVVMGLNYPNESDIEMGYTGDCIEIHATKRLKDGRLTPSGGCIKLFCDDALTLYNLVEIGTPVVISVTRAGLIGDYPFLGGDDQAFFTRGAKYD